MSSREKRAAESGAEGAPEPKKRRIDEPESGSSDGSPIQLLQMDTKTVKKRINQAKHEYPFESRSIVLAGRFGSNHTAIAKRLDPIGIKVAGSVTRSGRIWALCISLKEWKKTLTRESYPGKIKKAKKYGVPMASSRFLSELLKECQPRHPKVMKRMFVGEEFPTELAKSVLSFLPWRSLCRLRIETGRTGMLERICHEVCTEGKEKLKRCNVSVPSHPDKLEDDAAKLEWTLGCWERELESGKLPPQRVLESAEVGQYSPLRRRFLPPPPPRVPQRGRVVAPRPYVPVGITVPAPNSPMTDAVAVRWVEAVLLRVNGSCTRGDLGSILSRSNRFLYSQLKGGERTIGRSHSLSGNGSLTDFLNRHSNVFCLQGDIVSLLLRSTTLPHATPTVIPIPAPPTAVAPRSSMHLHVATPASNRPKTSVTSQWRSFGKMGPTSGCLGPVAGSPRRSKGSPPPAVPIPAAPTAVAPGSTEPRFQITSLRTLEGVLHFHCISAMPTYRSQSQEELRCEAYAAPAVQVVQAVRFMPDVQKGQIAKRLRITVAQMEEVPLCCLGEFFTSFSL